MKFTKMQAYCNDYVYVITFDQEVKKPAAAARFVSDRHKGVGSDGMIMICPSAIADFRMRVFNPDGSEAEMCGNALRSTGKLVYVKGLTSKTDFTVETLGGIKKIHLTVENGDVVNITANIGRPIFDADRIPVTVTNENNALIGYDYTILDRIFNITALSLGNPHCAVLCDDIYSIDIAKYGHALECSPIFPNKANIHFYDVTDRENIRMIAWERNCGELLRPFGGIRYSLFVQPFGTELLVRGTLAQDFDAVCSRCGGDFDFTVTVDDFATSVEIGEKTEFVDLTDELRQSIILALPSYPVCRQDCRGVCPTCGKNLNEGPCACDHTERDSRWGALDALELGTKD